MSSPVAGVLAIYKRVKCFAVTAIAMGKTKLQRFAGIMQRSINRFAVVGLQIFRHKVQQPVAGLEGLAVVDQLQAGVQVAVMPEPAFDVFRLEDHFLEN